MSDTHRTELDIDTDNGGCGCIIMLCVLCACLMGCCLMCAGCPPTNGYDVEVERQKTERLRLELEIRQLEEQANTKEE